LPSAILIVIKLFKRIKSFLITIIYEEVNKYFDPIFATYISKL